MKRKLGFILAGFAVSKEAIAIATTTIVTAVTLAPTLGFDPWPWVLGAVGGTIAQAWLPADKNKGESKNRVSSILSWLHGRKLHLFNIVASILLAGLGADYIIALFKFNGWPAPSIYLAAFICSAIWPFLAHLAWKKALKWSEA